AKTTPYELAEVTDAFIKMEALGLTASSEAMTAYGDTASGLGKSLNQMIEAVADASVGEFERLKEFGIKASSEGDKVKFTFKGIATEVGKNAKEIEEYLIGLGQANFAGGMERQMQTIGGQLSNLQDNWSSAFNAIGTAAMPVITTTIGGLNSAADAVRFMAENTDKLSAIAIPAMAAGLTVKAVPAIWSTSIALNAATASAGGFTAAMIAAGRASMAFMATPLGAALTAAGAAAAYLAFRTDETAESVAQLTEKAKELNVQLSSKEAEQQAKKLIALQQELQGLMARKQSGAVDVFGVKENELRQRIADIQNLKQETSELKTQSEMLLVQERGMGTQLEMLNQQTRDFGVSVNDVNKLIWEQGAAIASVKKQMDEWDRAFELIENDRKKLDEEAAQDLANPTKKSFDAALAAKKEATERSKKLYEEQKQAAKKASEEILQAHKDELASIKSAQDLLNSYLATDFDKQLAEIGKLDKAWVTLYSNGLSSQQQFADALYAMDLKEFPNKVESVNKHIVDDSVNSANAVRVAWEQSIRRLDDAFVSVWEDIFSSASDFGSSLKRWFTSLLAELAHAAITKQIVISMSGAIGIGGLSGAASAATGSLMMNASGGMSAISGTGAAGGVATTAADYATSSAVANVGASTVGGWMSSLSATAGGLSSGASAGLGYLGTGDLGFAAADAASLWGNGAYGQAVGTAAGAYLPIIGGALYGYQSTGQIGGAAAGAAGAYYGAQLGTMVMPGIGTAIGAVLGSIGGGALYTGIFGGGKKFTGSGVQMDYSGMGANANVNTYQSFSKDGGWFRSSSQWTEYTRNEQATQLVNESLAKAQKAAGKVAAKLSVNYTGIGAQNFSAGGADGATVEGWVKTIFDKMGTAILSNSEQYRKDNESLLDTVSRMVSQFEGMSIVLDKVNTSLGALSTGSVSALEELSKVAGGFDKLAQAQSSYFDLFYSATEKFDVLQKTLSQTLNNVGINVMPTTIADYKSMVASQDLTTDAGRTAYYALISNASSFKSYFDQTGAQTPLLSKTIMARFSDGGFTGVGARLEPAGIVHKGEYVVPAWMVKKQPDLVTQLESIRSNGFASGGMVGGLVSTSSDNKLYDLLKRMVDIIRKWDGDGMPEVRV
ncbi:MAG TPA: hypothetical protein PLF09_01845, partial [Thiotrichales bacterium]|nr:hypothetical protein [Thiotrichales bacterium]